MAAACSRPQAESGSAKVDKLFAQWDRPGSPGCALGVSRNRVPLYEHGYGVANLELGIPITPSSVFGAASISKQFKTDSGFQVASMRWSLFRRPAFGRTGGILSTTRASS
ncbi:MAG: hypothetical protein DMG04_13855 [Acidobacteria bacterium]|nr:MAG: hypothetical protein DMG04_13855 [Acidobacteriota bacterium]